MHALRQRQVLLIGSLGLTALLLGALAGAGVVWRTSREQMRDPAFLRAQLKEVDPQAGGPKGVEPALVRVAVAEEKMFRAERPIVGRLVEVRKVTVASEVTGKILEMPVEEGTPVEEGKTVLARVDEVWAKAAVDRCRAQVAWAQAQLDYESIELERHESLRDRAATTQSELESKRAQVAQLEAKRDEAKAALEEESERKKRCEIVAPFNGTVVVKHAERGAHVSPGTAIVDVVFRGQVDALLMVPESMVNLLREGQDLPVRVDPLGEEAPGKVASITPYGPSASRTFPVRVRLDDQEGRLKAGMSVTAMIPTAPERKALVVPRDAVLTRPDGSTVWVVAGGQGAEQALRAHPVPVRVRAQAANECEVEPETAGGRGLLTPGARVVIEGAERLAPRQEVRIAAPGARES